MTTRFAASAVALLVCLATVEPLNAGGGSARGSRGFGAARGARGACNSGLTPRIVRIPGPDPTCRGAVGNTTYFYSPPRPVYAQPGTTNLFVDTFRYANHPVRTFNTACNDRFQSRGLTAGGIVRYPNTAPGRFGSPGFGSRCSPTGDFAPTFGGHTRSFGRGMPIYGRTTPWVGGTAAASCVGPYSTGWSRGLWTESWVISNPPAFAYDPLFYYEREVTISQRQQFRDLASQRAGYLINQNMDLFDDGMAAFHSGQYEQAAVKFLGAADADHGAAASRLHAGHALFAIGRYDEAVRQLGRAFELSPLLVSRTYDIRDEYGDRSDFDRHLAALKAHVARNPNDAAGLTVLGYVLFRTEGSAAAHPVLRRAAQLDPGSFFIPRLLEVVSKTAPANGAARPPSAPARSKNSPSSPRASQGRLVKGN